MIEILQVLTIVSSLLLTLMILVQARGAGLGAGFGGSGELFTERRGIDKTMHQITIILAVVFVLSIVLSVISG